ncbi:MAG: lytic transglycosylase domain-containing protein [Clostridium sp.]
MLKKFAKILLVLAIIIGGMVALHKPILKQIYKLEHRETIDKYAEINNLDKYVVYSLIKKESKYDPLAVSKKGAMGLMQIMPETGLYLAKITKEKGFEEMDLYDAETNVKLGTYYLSKLRDDFKGNMDAALAAYNGGEGNVRKWMADNNNELDPDKIPFIQTKDYVKSINKDMKIYKYLYDSE